MWNFLCTIIKKYHGFTILCTGLTQLLLLLLSSPTMTFNRQKTEGYWIDQKLHQTWTWGKCGFWITEHYSIQQVSNWDCMIIVDFYDTVYIENSISLQY